MGAYPLRIYLSGSIKKGASDKRNPVHFWSPEDEDLIAHELGNDIILLNPAKSPIDRNDYFVNYGCDLYLVESSDVILADLRTEKGIGVGAELMYARMIGRPVVSWLPPESYYSRDLVEDVFGEDLRNWIHPFAFGLSDFIAPTLTDACRIIANELANGTLQQRADRSPIRAINAFRTVYSGLLKHD